MRPEKLTRPEHSKRSAQQVSEVTGGKLDYLIHDAAEVDVNTDSKGFDDQYVAPVAIHAP